MVKDAALDLFHPAVRRWFKESFNAPTLPLPDRDTFPGQFQQLGWGRDDSGRPGPKADRTLWISDVHLGRRCTETFIGGPQGHPCEKR